MAIAWHCSVRVAISHHCNLLCLNATLLIKSTLKGASLLYCDFLHQKKSWGDFFRNT